MPASTVLFRHSGTEVGVVDNTGRVVLKPIAIGTDYGQSVEVVSGLSATDKVIDNPTDSLATGDKVEVAGGQLAPEAGNAQR